MTEKPKDESARGEAHNEPQKDITALAREYAGYYNIPPQGEDEDDYPFRSRVAGVLRGNGNPVEAHEAFSGYRYDDPEQGRMEPMTGIIGVVAQALQGREFSQEPERKIGDDLAAGTILKAGEDPTRAALRSIFDTLGPAAGMDFIEGTRRKDE